jgi:hypothetical protein
VILFPLGEKFRRISPGQQTDGAGCSFEALPIFSTFSCHHTAFHKADQVHPENFSEFALSYKWSRWSAHAILLTTRNLSMRVE